MYWLQLRRNVDMKLFWDGAENNSTEILTSGSHNECNMVNGKISDHPTVMDGFYNDVIALFAIFVLLSHLFSLSSDPDAYSKVFLSPAGKQEKFDWKTARALIL